MMVMSDDKAINQLRIGFNAAFNAGDITVFAGHKIALDIWNEAVKP
jgi:hypothetical protein